MFFQVSLAIDAFVQPSIDIDQTRSFKMEDKILTLNVREPS